jgi:dTDP-4-amino-4,6-dideoxygalactose transaminase
MATAEAITFCGATPVFADIDPRTHTLDPECVEAAVTPRTRAIIPVHLYGQMADMDPILAIARRHNLRVIEDACQAHGAEYHGRRAGTLGDVGCFSFYPGKNLGAIGEAGAIVTDRPEIAEAVATLREHGQSRKYHHRRIGWNARMDGLQALVLSVKLEGLADGNARRRQHARRYAELLDGTPGLTAPETSPGRLHAFHLYVVRVPGRDEILAELARRGVHCGVHYPVPVHLQPAYRGLCYREGALPVAEQSAREVLSLPMFPELTEEQQKTVARELRDVLAHPPRLTLK